MSYIKEYKMGAISDDKYLFLARRENRKDRIDQEQEHDYAEDWEDDDDSEGGLIADD